MKNLILSLLLISFFSFSQENDVRCNTERTFRNAIYVGCMDVESKLDGFGKLTFDSGDIYEGNFKKDKKDGFGTYTSANADVYTGNWKNDMKHGNGKSISAEGRIYAGNWKNNMRNGEGKSSYQISNKKTTENGVYEYNKLFNGEKLIQFIGEGLNLKSVIKNGEITKIIQTNLDELGNTDYTTELIGSFFPNGPLKNGSKKRKSQNGNLIITNRYENGDEIIGSERSNIKNYYIPADIIGDLEEIEINLETEANKSTKYINLKIATETPTETFRFVFDTGSEVMSIGYNLFKKLKENGLKYEDLNVTIETVGVSGISNNNKVIRLNEITIDGYKVKNVIAFVKTSEKSNISLLGIGFMNKFKNVYWSLNDDSVIFKK